MSRLSDNLKQFRTAAGLTQPAVAAALGISRSAVAMYESGSREPELSLLWQLADLYGISLDELAGRQHPASPASVKLALFGTADAADDLLEDARAYAQFQQQRRK